MYKLTFFPRVNTSIYYTFEQQQAVIKRSSNRAIYPRTTIPLEVPSDSVSHTSRPPGLEGPTTIPTSRIIRIKYDPDDDIWEVGHMIEDVQYEEAIKAISDFMARVTDTKCQYLCAFLVGPDGVPRIVTLLVMSTGERTIHDAEPVFKARAISPSALHTTLCSNLLTTVRNNILLINPIEPYLLLMAIFLKSTGVASQTDVHVAHLITQLDPIRLLRTLKAMCLCITNFRPGAVNTACSSVFLQIHQNDKKYFMFKMRRLSTTIAAYQKTIKNLPELAQAYAVFLSELIAQAKKEYAVEAITMCSHFKNYPHELINLRAALGRQSYLDMLSFSHTQISLKRSNGSRNLSYEKMLGSITVGLEHDHVNYGFALKTREIIMSRCHVLEPAYQQHKLTVQHEIQSKNPCYQNYYPLKVFAPALMLFEHLLHSIPDYY